MDPSSFENLSSGMRLYFESGQTRPHSFRIDALKRFKNVIRLNEREILDALRADLGKPEVEAYSSEIGLLYTEINNAIKHLSRWMSPEKVRTPLLFFHSRSWIEMQPRGVVLIVSPWNYPCQLAWAPLVGAIAAGCCAIVKPSEVTPASAAVVQKVLTEAFEPHHISTVTGDGREVIPMMMDVFRFDQIFYTGGAAVGRKIAQAAATELIPVILELGGKSPCIVDDSANLDVAAKRIIWGKLWNAGQTCVAPDYVLVEKRSEKALLNRLCKETEGQIGTRWKNSPDYGRIVNKSHFGRLAGFLDKTEVVYGGKYDGDTLYMEPAIVRLSNADHPLMKEEIFGPILPVLAYSDICEAIDLIKRNPTPLALYVFSSNGETERAIGESLSFGTGCINNTVVQFAQPRLPFGGIGLSGYGLTHGRYSFETFSQRRAMMRTSVFIDVPVKYRPYLKKMKWFRFLMKP